MFDGIFQVLSSISFSESGPRITWKVFSFGGKGIEERSPNSAGRLESVLILSQCNLPLHIEGARGWGEAVGEAAAWEHFGREMASVPCEGRCLLDVASTQR